MRAADSAYSTSMFGAIRPILKHWRPLMGVSLLAGGITGFTIWMLPRKYEASMTLSTIASSRTPSVPGGLGGLLAGASLGVTGPNPSLITRIAGEYGVLLRVAGSPMRENSRETIAERLRRSNGSDIPNRDLVRELRKMIGAGVDKASGVIVITAISKDSTLARAVTETVVRETSRTFIGITRAQGSELHLAMQNRLDSAGRQLRSAEDAQRRFLSANRVVAPFSPAAVEQTKLRQSYDLALQVYTQTLTDRESAVAKELEATPAVVVIDPVPAELPPLPRFVAMKSVAAALLAALLFGLLIIARESARRAVNDGDPDAIQLAMSAREIRFGGFVLRWLFPVSEPDRYELSVAPAEGFPTATKRLSPRPPERAQGE